MTAQHTLGLTSSPAPPSAEGTGWYEYLDDSPRKAVTCSILASSDVRMPGDGDRSGTEALLLGRPPPPLYDE